MIRLLVAEDGRLIRDALVALLSLQPDFEVVAEVDRGDNVLAVALQHQPDIVLIDIGLPKVDGLTTAKALMDQLPECKVIVLTALDHPANVRRAIDASVAAFLAKDVPVAELVECIRRVARGERIIDTDRLVSALRHSTPMLTPGECTVLRAIGEGATVAEVADMLCLTAGTVRNYLAAAVRKLDARTRVDAVRIARDHGWI